MDIYKYITYSQAKSFHGELQDMLLRLSEIDGQLITAQPVGGLPETAREQLDKFMEIFHELENHEPRVRSLMKNGDQMVDKSPEVAAQNLKHSLQNLETRWDNIMSRANDRKTKLHDAVNKAENFHIDLNQFINWLTNTEKTINNLKGVSRVLENVRTQIDNHKDLQKDISSHRETMVDLDKTGTHLKYFSQKQVSWEC